ncbi:hypothetical protein HZH66_008222 [Vespula vulgaris]|uniref:Uncharacterized protein n=2 Tax=Vespula TaxID=7451 RepID=A0A834JUR5_VESVU|nr:hypothetical protein HZH66_008222 [Vespula vulgaris]
MTSHGDFSTANSLFRATEKVEFHSDLIQSNDLGITQNQIRSIVAINFSCLIKIKSRISSSILPLYPLSKMRKKTQVSYDSSKEFRF